MNHSIKIATRLANIVTVSNKTWNAVGRVPGNCTVLETPKSLMPSTILVLQWTSFQVSAGVRCHLLAEDEIGVSQVHWRQSIHAFVHSHH